MKLCIAGSRTWEDYESVEKEVDKLNHLSHIELIISGTARGADTLGELYAQRHNIPLKRMPADWNKYGKKAGYIRNEQMAKLADTIIVFWDKKSKGSKNMIIIAQGLNKPTFVVTRGPDINYVNYVHTKDDLYFLKEGD